VRSGVARRRPRPLTGSRGRMRSGLAGRGSTGEGSAGVLMGLMGISPALKESPRVHPGILAGKTVIQWRQIPAPAVWAGGVEALGGCCSR